MKKFLAGLVVLFMLVISLPLAADAQTCRTKRYKRSNVSQRYAGRNYRTYRNRSYQTQGYNYQRQRPSFYRRHRNLINVGIGTGAGALLGALIGGKRGAGWGALAGAGGSALYTYKIRPKKRRY